MLIRELEEKTGLDRATIRYYEKEGLIQPSRGENGYRTYSDGDMEDLLKIKLLRQLGMPLFRIQALKEGSEDLSEAIAQHLDALQKQLQATVRSIDVCNQIQSDGCSYQTLNAALYLKLMEQGIAKREFRESVRQEIRPWRRYFARELDNFLVSSVLEFVFIVVFRFRPIPSFIELIFGLIVIYCAIPWYAFCLHMWGTTPGKLAFGIRVEAVDGGKLNWKDALWREFNVVRFGLGYGIPFWIIWRLYRSYKEYTTQGRTEYDEDCEYTCANMKTKQWITMAGTIALCLILNIFAGFDNVHAQHRGDLTVAQFSQNFNNEARKMDIDSRLDLKGKFEKQQGFGVIIDLTPAVNENAQFQFVMEGDVVKSVSYENKWMDPIAFTPLSDIRLCAFYAMANSRKDLSVQELGDLYQYISDQIKQGNPDLDYTYGSIRIQWTIETENTECRDGMYFTQYAEFEGMSWAEMELTVSIVD